LQATIIDSILSGEKIGISLPWSDDLVQDSKRMHRQRAWIFFDDERLFSAANPLPTNEILYPDYKRSGSTIYTRAYGPQRKVEATSWWSLPHNGEVSIPRCFEYSSPEALTQFWRRS
jgi:hypothetical protein